jgi:hypothetical protein
MRVHFVYELVEVVLVALAQVDKGLDRLVRICRCVLLATLVDNLQKVS